MWSVLLMGGMAMATEATPVAEAPPDPWGWLEGVQDARALEFVAARNAESLGELTASPDYEALRSRLLGILDSDEKIPYVEEMGGLLYNFWQDATHPRGLWRRTTWASYRTASPSWEVVLDLDALSAKEGESWVWHGQTCLPPAWDRCLISLSRGGADADVTREFDMTTLSFREDGFALPEAKGSAGWLDADHLWVTTDLGPGTMTTSGYPRQARLWTRGTPLGSAELVFEGQETDVAVSAGRDATPGFERDLIGRGITFYTSETWLRTPVASGPPKLVLLDVPLDANPILHREHLLVELRSDWTVGGQTFVAGSLIATHLDAFLAGERSFTALFTPTERSALAGVTPTRGAIVVNALEDVRSRLTVWRFADGAWTSSPLGGLPEFGTVSVSAVDPWTDDRVWLTVTDFLTPTTLSVLDLAAPAPQPEVLKALPAFFDAKGLRIQQREATSADGTKVPYFLVAREGVKLHKKTPTLLYGYGGFEVSLTPSYNATAGASWLERGGAYALANIRGGGEFGPRWHQAALKENRHKAYEDFAAVARDLIASKLTSPEHLGAMGGSNGGLLMGNMLTQYPELFGAIVCQVPLLDMRRYHTLLAGASWMGEYGDPDDPEQWKFIQTFSPYHLVRDDGRYPRVLFTTSTRDDRVHPGHARKMVAKMREQGHDVLYWENTEGGHGGAANNAQRAMMWALSWTFLWNELK